MPELSAQGAMRPVSTFPRERAGTLSFLLTDIDDTLTTDGRLSAEAYRALERMEEAGIAVIPVTGRPAGWCDLIARFWPVAAVVGENGAFYFRYERASRRMTRRYWLDRAAIDDSRAKLQRLAAKIVAEIPGIAISEDQPYRLADLALDYREDVPPLPQAAAERAVAILEAAGAVAKISSIHVNAWFGSFDKLAMTKKLFAEVFAIDLERRPENVVFIGDSPNDAPMFAFFPLSVGVANIREFTTHLKTPPAYVTAAASGAGFVEFAEILLARTQQPAKASSRG
jgi:HAD superfamily hydrolase (TIGR01484 family)